MRILCVTDSLDSGGAQRQLVALAKGFKEKGHEVSFLTYHNRNFFYEDLIEDSIDVTCIEEANYLKRLWKMRRFIRKVNYDVVLSFLEASAFICEISGLPSRQWRLVVGERSANPNIATSFKLKMYRWFHLFADHVVANSHQNIEMIRTINPYLSAKKCHVIYNMIDLGKWKPAIDYVPFFDNKFNLIVVASHQYNKNARGLIEGVSRLTNEEKESLKVDWYGDERNDMSLFEAKKLVDKYKLQDIFNFHNATNRIIEKIKYSDALGLFSFYEGLPNVICEAMALGKPVISSSISDIPLFLDNKEVICTFDPNDVVEISRVLSHCISNKETLLSCGPENRERAKALFDKDIIVNKYLKILSE